MTNPFQSRDKAFANETSFDVGISSTLTSTDYRAQKEESLRSFLFLVDLLWQYLTDMCTVSATHIAVFVIV